MQVIELEEHVLPRNMRSTQLYIMGKDLSEKGHKLCNDYDLAQKNIERHSNVLAEQQQTRRELAEKIGKAEEQLAQSKDSFFGRMANRLFGKADSQAELKLNEDKNMLKVLDSVIEKRTNALQGFRESAQNAIKTYTEMASTYDSFSRFCTEEERAEAVDKLVSGYKETLPQDPEQRQNHEAWSLQRAEFMQSLRDKGEEIEQARDHMIAKYWPMQHKFSHSQRNVYEDARDCMDRAKDRLNELSRLTVMLSSSQDRNQPFVPPPEIVSEAAKNAMFISTGPLMEEDMDEVLQQNDQALMDSLKGTMFMYPDQESLERELADYAKQLDEEKQTTSVSASLGGIEYDLSGISGTIDKPNPAPAMKIG